MEVVAILSVFSGCSLGILVQMLVPLVYFILENSCSQMWVRPKSDGMTDMIVKWGVFVSGEKGPTCKGLEKRCDQIIL